MVVFNEGPFSQCQTVGLQPKSSHCISQYPLITSLQDSLINVFANLV